MLESGGGVSFDRPYRSEPDLATQHFHMTPLKGQKKSVWNESAELHYRKVEEQRASSTSGVRVLRRLRKSKTRLISCIGHRFECPVNPMQLRRKREQGCESVRGRQFGARCER